MTRGITFNVNRAVNVPKFLQIKYRRFSVIIYSAQYEKDLSSEKVFYRLS